MPPTTRSANKQTKLEDVGAGAVSSKSSPKGPAPKKRKATENGGAGSSYKKTKPAPVKKQDGAKGETGGSGESITINRAPVLELWGACVTQFLYPSLSWPTCLSAGSAVSTIAAISKGRSIGKIDKPDPGEAQKKREERKEKAEREGLDELEVMSFKLHLNKDGQALVGGKPKKGDEETLKKKFGDSQYDTVKNAFNNALQAWKGKGDELQQSAFNMYESFRPSIPPGQSGWGRKGQLDLETVDSVITSGL